MQLSTDYGFAFLCMPKCASTSIEYAVRQYTNIKYAGPEIKHINAQNFQDYVLRLHRLIFPEVAIETFCLMRNPVKWLFSWYRYRQRDAIKNPSHQFHRNYTGDISFNEFIEAYLIESNKPSFADVGTQSKFIKLNNGRIGVDRIFLLENIEMAAKYISKKIGEPVNIPFLNISPKINLTLDKMLEQKLREFIEDDFLLFEAMKKNEEFITIQHEKELWNQY